MKTTSKDLDLLGKAINELQATRSIARSYLCYYGAFGCLDKFDADTNEITAALKHVEQDWEDIKMAEQKKPS